MTPAPLHIVVVTASTRTGRVGPDITAWVDAAASTRNDLTTTVVDLANADLGWDLADPGPGATDALDALAAADGFVLVVPEYNHGFPAPLKQLIDLADDQFRARPVSFVTYAGGISAGVRAADALRGILAGMRAVTLRESVAFPVVTELVDETGRFTPPARAVEALTLVFDELAWWGLALRSARQATTRFAAADVPEATQALFVTHRTLPGRRDDVHRVWDTHLRPLVEANPDHLAYAYCGDSADPDVLRVFQLYRDPAAAAAFLDQPGYATYLEHVLPLVAEPPRLETAEPLWIKV